MAFQKGLCFTFHGGRCKFKQKCKFKHEYHGTNKCLRGGKSRDLAPKGGDSGMEKMQYLVKYPDQVAAQLLVEGFGGVS